MSDLKIFIVGPVGAGKTVFAYMLKHYVETHPECGVAYKDADWKTKEYFAKVQAEFTKFPWCPDPTSRGALIELKWEWQFDGRRALFDLVDPPGEDIQRELCGESCELRILERIRTADVVFVLMDLYGHQGDPPIKQALNAWIVQNVLGNATAVRQIVIGVSKGDMMRHRLPVEFWADKHRLMELISELMPQFSLNAFRQQLSESKVQLVMFSAHETESHLHTDGKPYQRPKQPFESQGLDVFVKTITQAHEEKQWDKLVQKVCRILKRVVTSKIFLALLVVMIALGVWKASCQNFRITFTTSRVDRAGTDAHVYLKLIGDERESWRINFDGRRPSDSETDSFEEGAVDVFERTVWRVGSVSEVVVGHDDSGADAYGKPSGGWHLEKVEVEEWHDGSWGPKTTFPFGGWLDQSTGYGLERKLHKGY